jgi:hypothetical protein
MHPASYHTITACLIVTTVVSSTKIFVVVLAFICYDCAATEFSCTMCVEQLVGQVWEVKVTILWAGCHVVWYYMNKLTVQSCYVCCCLLFNDSVTCWDYIALLNEYEPFGGIILTKENQSAYWTTFPNATLSTTNPTWIGLELSLDFCCERPVTNYFIHGTAPTCVLLLEDKEYLHRRSKTSPHERSGSLSSTAL